MILYYVIIYLQPGSFLRGILMKFLLVSVLIIKLSTSLFAQNPNATWDVIIDMAGFYGIEGSPTIERIQQTEDGGYFAVGTFDPVSGQSFGFATKVDSSGSTLWIQTYEFDAGESDQLLNDGEITFDGGFILVGSATDSNALFNRHGVWLIKTNSAGDTLWTRIFHNNLEQSESGLYVEQTLEGGYIITGKGGGVDDDILLAKTNSVGDTLWTKLLGIDCSDLSLRCMESGTEVHQTNDGGFIIIGEATHSTGDNDFDIILIKTDSSGDTLWTRAYGGELNDFGKGVQQTSDGGYIIIGEIDHSAAKNGDIWLLKTDTLGDTLWTKRFSSDVVNDFASDIQLTADGGFILAGRLASNVWLTKIDSSGNIMWTDEWIWGNIRSIQQTQDGGFILAGTDPEVVRFMKLPPQLPVIKLSRSVIDFGSVDPGSNNEQTFKVSNLNTGRSDLVISNITIDDSNFRINDTSGVIVIGGEKNFIVTFSPFKTNTTFAGQLRIYSNAADVVTIRLEGNTNPVSIISESDIPALDYGLSLNYPNPFNPTTTIKFALPKSSKVLLSVYNLSGEEIIHLLDEEKNAGYHKVIWDASGFTSGLYFYRLQAGDFVQTRKMVLLK